MNILKKISGWFQPAYNKLIALDWPPEVKKMIDGIWNGLSPEIQKALVALIIAIYQKYGQKKAQEILNSVIAKVS